MMEIACENCGKKYRIDETKITSDKAKFACKGCDHVMIVKKEEERATASTESPYQAQSESPAEKKTEAPEEEKSESAPADAESKIDQQRISWVNSIQFRISALLVVITTLIMGAYAWINYNDVKKNMEAEITHSSEIITERLSKLLVEPFWALDDDMLEDLLRSEMMDPQIYAIHIKDRDGRTTYMGRKRNRIWKIIESPNEIRGKYSENRKGILKNKEKIGAVEVYLTSRFMEEQFRSSMMKFFITSLILIAAIFVSMFWALRKIIILPIRNLTAATERISMGDLDSEVTMKSKNEIGLLAQAIGRMQTSLQFAQKRLSR